MRPFREYNLIRITILIISCVFLGALPPIYLGRNYGVFLFEIYSGLPGYLCIIIAFGLFGFLQKKYDEWLTDD